MSLNYNHFPGKFSTEEILLSHSVTITRQTVGGAAQPPAHPHPPEWRKEEDTGRVHDPR